MQCERILVSNDILQAGQLKFSIKQLQTITSDNVILDIAKHYKLDFRTVLTQTFPSQQPNFEKCEEIALKALLDKLLQNGVAAKCFHEFGEFM